MAIKPVAGPVPGAALRESVAIMAKVELPESQSPEGDKFHPPETGTLKTGASGPCGAIGVERCNPPGPQEQRLPCPGIKGAGRGPLSRARTYSM